MKVYKKDTKLIFTNSINQCLKDLNFIIQKIEDKNNDLFPVNEISNFIKNCKEVTKDSEDLMIPKEYLDFTKENKEVLRYFIEKEREVNKNKEISDSRENIIKEYLKGIEKYI
ncbi:uncharacterized protein VNE69_03206 [Vairimorpha necatrix]|uniref:Uncharacterized protein n=1 Tax=Vairimorpha necatrix TaxID=6039 RepID=A0AAX4JAN7_9MICR